MTYSSNTASTTARQYDGGITAVDTAQVRREMAAGYILQTSSQVALIEVGTNASADHILRMLQQLGRQPDDVSHIIVTHVHLDHAGGAGRLMQALPQARLVVHPRGARHLVDPSRLEAGARAVYGDEAFDAMYGSLVPVPEERVSVMADGDSLSVGGRRLEFMDSPGHAKHHFCIWDEVTRGWFTGDTFGISYRDLDTHNGPFVFPTTTPVQFDPPALIASVRNMAERKPDYLYLTHYGRVAFSQRLADDMIAGVEKLVEIGEAHATAKDRKQRIQSDMTDWLMAGCEAHGVRLPKQRLHEVLDDDVDLNTQGIEFWLDHRSR